MVLDFAVLARRDARGGSAFDQRGPEPVAVIAFVGAAFSLSTHSGGQAADPVALKAAVQRRLRQMRDRGLEGVEAVVEGQQRALPEGDHYRLILDRQ